MTIDENNLPVIVAVRFSKIGKNYFFDASNIANLKLGDHLIVETSRGWQIGELTEFISDQKIRTNTKYKLINRIATEDDLLKKNRLAEKAEEAVRICHKEIARLGLSEIKIISAEFSLDEKNLSFIYSCSSDESPNLNPLKSTISRIYPKIRIDYHKIGPRDVARYYGGMGACGLASRCCTQFLKDFESISINMAKKQGISLTPSDITGMCERLRCCLQYENECYIEALSHLPRRNKIVYTPKGRGRVVDLAPLKGSVFVLLDEVGVKEFSVDEITEETGQAIKSKLGKTSASYEKDQQRRQRPKKRK